MSKTYWSQRIEELANSEKAVPDTVFFTSEAYRSYTETAAKDMFPPEVRRYGGMTAEFKATSQHIPVELLKKISFRLEGHWAPDSKEENEKIFVAEKATEILPETESEVCKFLMRNCSSLGKTMANHIVERFGMNTLDVCAHHCKQLFDIPRIDDKVIAKLNDACLSALVRADVLKLLQGVDVSPSAINTLVETYGNETIHVLENNPYKPVPILGFAVMDHIALAMGEPVDSERRMTCATIEALHIACQKTGSMCAEESAILARMAALTPQVSAERQKESLDDVAKVYAIVKQGKYYYDKDDFLAERKMSAKIVELASAEPIKEREIEDAFIKWQKENAIILSPRQAEAVRNLKYRISIVTGGPGTGKTTCLRAIMDVYHILIGPPGSGKSFGYVRTAVFQSIVRGESVVVTDPKGEIHNDMRKLLESRGYKVKVFNLINLDLSNAWDCVQEIYDPITGNIDDQRVITFCKTVIANTGGGANSKGDPFWESSEENLFRVAVSYCAYIREKSLIEIYERRAKELLTQLPYITQEDEQSLIEIVKNPESAMVDRRRVVEYLAHSFYGDEEGDRKLSEWEEDAPTCNISDIYDALLHNDLDKWEANFKYVPLSHPAASAWAVFKGMGERVQPNIVGGLNTRLQLFMTYKVRRVISNDDIRLANLGAEKTALFLIISDDNASMQLLSSLLLSFLFKDLKEAFDAVGGEGRIPVNVVADELANTGVWPNFEKTIATARSRKIAVSLILQSLPQLTQLYGEENAETIIGCCNTMLVLGCNDMLKHTSMNRNAKP